MVLLSFNVIAPEVPIKDKHLVSEEELINGNPTKRGEGGFGHTGVRQMPNQ